MVVPVSVSIVSYNGRDDLRDCLRSLYQPGQFPFAEILVVDNASTDGTSEMVAAEFPRVRVIRMPTNDGPCPARNVGLSEARHDLVFQLDQDVLVRNGCVERLLLEFEREQDVAVAAPRALDAARPDVVHYDGGSFHYAGVMALRHFFVPLDRCTHEAADVDAFISLAALVDRVKLRAVGGYDAAFFILFEDHDLSYRLRLAGWRIRALPDALVDHRAGTAGISFRGGPSYPARRLFLHSRNRWRVVLKNYRKRTLVLALPGLLLLGLAYVVFALREGALGEYVKAKSSLIAQFPEIRAQRKAIAKFRKQGDRRLLGAPDLTFSPRIDRGKTGSFGERVLSGLLRAWWACVSWLVP